MGDFQSEPMTREEAKRILRRLELDAYSAVVTAFRAQGDMNKTKKTLLGELSNQLSISTERHRAEVRRVVNDDRLNAVAECMHLPGTSTEWSIEGCRLVSLMPRLVPQTVFTAKATAAANQAVENNQKLPIKSEIEVLPLPTKMKNVPKTDRGNENRDDKSSKLSQSNDITDLLKVDDKLKRKKKPNILYTKPSPLALNKNPFKPSSTPTSLKSMIKNTPLKYSSVGGGVKTAATSSIVSSSTAGPAYSQRPIILQRSPAKTMPAVTRASSITLQAVSSSLNTPLASLGSALSTTNNSKMNCDNNSSTALVQPMIKVVSNSQNIPVSVSSIGVNAANVNNNNSITQKIKFKTPIPKPKVKATKFKPMVPIQRPSILSSSQNAELTLLGQGSATITQTSPSKPSSLSQGMSVKVVQVTKSSSQSLSSSSLISNLNKPVVVVSNSVGMKTPSQKLTFNAVPSSITQQLKVASAASLSTSITQSLPKGTLTSKSMPLATGFKMIAVTTVVPGTTQVKTVYIATPIMSLTKTVSQTTGASITTPANQNVRHISSSLASNLQSVVARSINSSQLGSVGKAANIHNISSASPSLSSNTSVPIGKTNRLVGSTAAGVMATTTTTNPAKGLGSLKAALTGTAQSLKLFTAVSKTKSVLTTVNTSKSTPLLPSTGLLTSSSAQQQQQQQKSTNMKLNDVTSNRLRNDKQEVHNHSQTNNPSNTFLNITSLGVNSVQPPQLSNGIDHNITSLPASIALNANSLEEVSATLNMLNEENPSVTATTEQITATATADTDDMAFLNAGEKFLEQLSAKMTATSPESFTKNDTFLFPSNLTLDLAGDPSAHSLRDLSKENSEYEMNNLASTVTIDKNVILQNGSKQPQLIAKDPGYVISQKVLSQAPKILNSLLPAGAKILQPASGPALNSNNNSVMVAPVFQQKQDYNSRAVLNYTNIATNVSGKSPDLGGKDSHFGGGNPTTSGIIIDGNPSKARLNSIKISTPQTSNKLAMSIPGSSKLNISPLLVSNKAVCTDVNNKVASELPRNANVNTQVLNKSLNPLTNVQFFVSSSTTHNIGETVLVDDAPKLMNDSGNIKKRKFADISSPTSRPQASWVRSAANLLNRVSRFRGVNKQKGDMDAASWFTKPVNPSEEPGYYSIIKKPMDFGKIKLKLEGGEYETYTQFYEDMLLVKHNCHAYNPSDHAARKDCDDVFAFFEGEYQKLLERWEKYHVSPQKRPKTSEENGNT